MGEKRSEEDDLEGITAILLKASRLSEATPKLVWTGNKPESAGGHPGLQSQRKEADVLTSPESACTPIPPPALAQDHQQMLCIGLASESDK